MKTMIKMMLLASTVMMTSCLADDPFSDGSNTITGIIAGTTMGRQLPLVLAAVLLQQAN